jgi:hypothetical protein
MLQRCRLMFAWQATAVTAVARDARSSLESYGFPLQSSGSASWQSSPDFSAAPSSVLGPGTHEGGRFA